MKRILIIGGLLLALGLAYGLYEFNRTGKDTAKQDAAFSLSAEKLSSAFEADESAANQQYLDKVIEVDGVLMNLENGDQVVLTLKGTDMVNVRVELSADQTTDLEAGGNIKIKGICTGLLLDVVLTEGVIID